MIPIESWVNIEVIWGARLVGFVEECGGKWCVIRTVNDKQEAGLISKAQVLDVELEEDDRQALIDLALQTKDEAWFNELCEGAICHK